MRIDVEPTFFEHTDGEDASYYCIFLGTRPLSESEHLEVLLVQDYGDFCLRRGQYDIEAFQDEQDNDWTNQFVTRVAEEEPKIWLEEGVLRQKLRDTLGTEIEIEERDVCLR
jgi:hypothetical protein